MLFPSSGGSYNITVQNHHAAWGDGSKPKRSTNSISTGTNIVHVGPWGPRKIFLASKTMNFQPQHIQKREIVEFPIINHKYKIELKTWSHSIWSKMPQQKNGWYSWSPITAKSANEVVIYLSCTSNIFFLTFLAFQLPSPPRHFMTIKTRSRSTISSLHA